MGGMVAQELALRHPDRIRTLTLGCTYCGGEGAALASSQVSTKLAEAMMSGDPDRAIATAYEVNVSPGYGADKSAYGTFYEMATALPTPVPVIMLQMQAIQAHNTLDRLHEITAPTLVIHGTVDEMLPYSNAVLIASKAPSLLPEALLTTTVSPFPSASAGALPGAISAGPHGFTGHNTRPMTAQVRPMAAPAQTSER
jgi:pimeloyl-ACP methyl ester carboxylesterase